MIFWFCVFAYFVCGLTYVIGIVTCPEHIVKHSISKLILGFIISPVSLAAFLLAIPHFIVSSFLQAID